MCAKPSFDAAGTSEASIHDRRSFRGSGKPTKRQCFTAYAQHLSENAAHWRRQSKASLRPNSAKQSVSTDSASTDCTLAERVSSSLSRITDTTGCQLGLDSPFSRANGGATLSGEGSDVSKSNTNCRRLRESLACCSWGRRECQVVSSLRASSKMSCRAVSTLCIVFFRLGRAESGSSTRALSCSSSTAVMVWNCCCKFCRRFLSSITR
mmetsp:Transcript_66635/g.159272  ORF Transcript_66635/g.159272 Transcript_66635/m.159272 type:complete len:209 (-) Transcript_66635:1217-1843(-)